MRKTFLCVLLAISVCAMGESRKSFFTLNLEDVDRNEETISTNISNSFINGGLSINSFQDSLIDVIFQYEMTHINFRLKNLTSKTIKIHWDEAMLYVRNSAHTVFHGGIVIKNRSAHKNPTSVLKGMECNDMLIPCETVSWSSYFGRWLFEPLLSGQEWDNSGVKVLLPIEINGSIVEYVFNFTAHFQNRKVVVEFVNGGMCEYVKVK